MYAVILLSTNEIQLVPIDQIYTQFVCLFQFINCERIQFTPISRRSSDISLFLFLFALTVIFF